VRTTVKDSLGVLWRAVVLLGRHWPALLMISLFGSAAHGLLEWSAVRASRISSGLGMLVLVLVPIALLVTLVLMLRTLRPSLAYLTRVARTGQDDRRDLMAVVASVAVPFLTIYTTYDYLKEDVSDFAYEVWRDSALENPLARLPFSPTIGVMSIVAIALTLRWLFNRVSTGFLRVVTVPLGAYVEVLWLCTVTMGATVIRGKGSDWLDNRQAGVWWHSFWDQLSDFFQPVRLVLEAFWSNVDVVVFAPIAWLALGAVVYGRQLAERRMTDERLATGAMRWASRLPSGLSFAVSGAGSVLYNRFAPLINGLRMLGRAGLRPMLIFCVAFVVLQLSPQGIWEIERALIGPHDLQKFWMPLSYLTVPVNSAIRWVLIVCLVAAATDRILESDGATPDTPAPFPAPVSPGVPVVPATSGVHSAEALTR
jgi:hypothetical protein